MGKVINHIANISKFVSKKKKSSLNQYVVQKVITDPIKKGGISGKGCFNLEHVQVLHILMSLIFEDICIQNATSLKVSLYFATLC